MGKLETKQDILKHLKEKGGFIRVSDNTGWYFSYHCVFCNLRFHKIEEYSEATKITLKEENLYNSKNHNDDCPMQEVL